ncbi:hypothetical protein [Aureimonas sp. Leaf454]|uniref:hypothetical protein n=1 Tax=Aureimonas sp. Leaf454 TaxID=1736381 RepID=UPI0012E3BED7|nr:hypothetical protein [Aureimonas sp. Leaf454]
MIPILAAARLIPAGSLPAHLSYVAVSLSACDLIGRKGAKSRKLHDAQPRALSVTPWNEVQMLAQSRDALDLGADELVELVLRGHRGGRSHGEVGKQRVEPPRHVGRFVMVGQPK